MGNRARRVLFMMVQPGGLSDSSRWSQLSADHRIAIENNSTPGKGVRKNGGTPPGCELRGAFLSGGLRYAATTGYYLTALQAEIRSRRLTYALGSSRCKQPVTHPLSASGIDSTNAIKAQMRGRRTLCTATPGHVLPMYRASQ